MKQETKRFHSYLDERSWLVQTRPYLRSKKSQNYKLLCSLGKRTLFRILFVCLCDGKIILLLA